jgi:hypothetical protein
MSRFNVNKAIFLPCHEPSFQLTALCFNHLFTTFLKPTIENSLSTYSNCLSRVALNFSNDVGSWCSQSITLTYKIQRINVLTTSSQAFFPSNPPFISPLAFIWIWWGFFPTTCLASNVAFYPSYMFSDLP